MVAFDPEEILAYCTDMVPASILRTDYQDNDFTIYMRRT